MKWWWFAVLMTLAGGVIQADETKPQEKPKEEKSAEEATDDTVADALKDLRKSLETLGRMKLTGYVQAQYVHDDSSENALTSPSATRNRDQFSVRRARVKFTHQVGKNSKLVWAPDVSSSGAALKDAWVEFSEPWTSWRNTLTAGQFTWPFGFELLYSSGDREMPERTRAIRALFPGERDRGVMLSGSGVNQRFRYTAAIVNGTGTTQSFDMNKRKDFVGRISGTLGPLDLGLSIYRGADLVATSAVPSGVEFDKQREGIDFQLDTPIEGLAFRGEYVRGKQPPASGAAGAAAAAADVEGWYVYAVQNLGKRNQFVVRLDSYDPNDGDKVPSTSSLAEVTTLGASYIFHWDSNSRVMLSYEHPDTNLASDPDDDLVTLRYQYKF